MTLADVIDLEAQLGRDRDADPEALDARDRRLASGKPPSMGREGLLLNPQAPGSPPGASFRRWLAERRESRRRALLIKCWLDALRGSAPGRFFPGRAVAQSLRTVRAVLVALGALLGWGTAVAVLHYDGREPVNVWNFLLVMVGVQLLLLALLLGSFLLPGIGGGVPLLGALRGLAAATYPRLAGWLLRTTGRLNPARAAGMAGRQETRDGTAWSARSRRPQAEAVRDEQAPDGACADRAEDSLEQWRGLWHRLRSRRSLYRKVEPWTLLTLTQWFGVAFNVAALLSCLRLIAFSDLAFSWSTTLIQLDSGRFHEFVRALAAPWSWALTEAVPSRALIDATRYVRLEGAYVPAHPAVGVAGAGRAIRPELVGGWWPFLLAALGCYGFLPRVLALVSARVLQSRTLASLPLDDAEVTRLVARLTGPHVETRSEGLEGSPPPWPQAAARSPLPVGGRIGLVLWRDVPDTPELTEAVARRTGGAVESVLVAGGRDHEEGTTDWAGVGGGLDGFVVVAEAFEAPDRGVLSLLGQLREALGPRRHLGVLLTDEVALARVGEVASARKPPRRDDLRLWREGLSRLEDPYLSVDDLVERAR